MAEGSAMAEEPPAPEALAAAFPPGFREQVRHRFARGATHYEQEARLQRAVAWRLARLCRDLPLEPGPRADLGAGTGLLSRALLQQWPNGPEPPPLEPRLQQLDLCPDLLARNPLASPAERQGWDLHRGLPPAAQNAALLASSFALQWLEDPAGQLGRWCGALAPGGWLAVAVPTAGSFPQWHAAAAAAAVPCTALPLPAAEPLIAAATAAGLQLRHRKRLHFSRPVAGGAEALRRLQRLGAGASPSPPLSAPQLRRLLRHWSEPRLSWEVLLLVGQRPRVGVSAGRNCAESHPPALP
ncbi:MAG: SAM-dependent methyltransferase [Synechococcus sp.]|nr:SAM-dependent methyltransferase [Synechococcus sp.]